MVRTLLVRGMLVGILAGLLAYGFARVLGEPQIELALAFEDHARQAAGAPPEPEPVSRAVQGGLGLLTGLVVYGSALGGLFALAFAWAHERVLRLRPFAASALLAAGGLVVLVVVPQLKYPASPPSVGGPETIGARTALHFGMIVLSLIAAAVALGVGKRLAARLGGRGAALAGAAIYAVMATTAALGLPSVHETPTDFPAAVLRSFRLASLGTNLVLWAALGLGFGWLTERNPMNRPASGPRRVRRT